MSLLKTTVDWWSGWSDIFGITAVILGGVLAIVTFLGWGFSWKAGKLKDAALETYKADAKQSVAEADAKAAEANQRAAQAELETQRLKKELAWRDVTPDQASILRDILKGISIKITISWVAGDPEGSEFAQRLGKALVDSDVTVAAFAPIAHLGEEPHGLSISGSEQREIDLLSKALEKADFKPVAIRVVARKPDGTRYLTHLEIGYRTAPTLESQTR